MEWPGWDEPPVPVVITGRPNRLRPRHYTDHNDPRQRLYRGPDGQLLAPVSTTHHRAASVSGIRPAQVIINNDNGVQWEDMHNDGRRPSSSHGGGRYYDDERQYEKRDHSRVRARTPSPYLDYETRQKLKELEDLKKASEDEKRKKQIEEELLLQQAMEEKERLEREKEEKELKKRAIEEYKLKEAEEKVKKEKQKEKDDAEFRERMRQTLWANGYSDEQIERLIHKAEHKGTSHHGNKGKGRNKELAMSRPTFVKVHRKHIAPETLDEYDLPWEWDDDDSNYIIVKTWIPEHDQEILFEHTRNLRERKQIAYTTTELRKEHDQMLLVRKKEAPRKKSPVKTSWFLT